MYGLIVKLTAAAGRRDDLTRTMGGEDSGSIPGCLSFVVSEDVADDDVLWITEVWDSQESHERSLKRPSAEATFPEMDTVVVAYEKVATTRPVDGSSHPLHGEG